MAADSGVVIGAFYETPDGRIARTCGWGGATQVVSFHRDDDAGVQTIHADDLVSSWRGRPDLVDFPDARDPRVPYVFDLLWDVKRRSELVSLLASGVDEGEVRDAMGRSGVVLTDAESSALEEARAAAAPSP